MRGSVRGLPERVTNAYTKILSGTLNAVAASSTPLSDTTDPIYEVLVQNSSSTQVTLLVGNANRQDVEIAAGSHIVIPVCDLRLVYVRGDGGTAVVNYMAMAWQS